MERRNGYLRNTTEELATMKHYDDNYDFFVTLEDKMRESFFGTAHIAAQEARVDKFAKLLPGSSVLGLGCGTATDFERFEERHIDFIGIDLSENMIKAGHVRAPAAQLSRMNMRVLGFNDNDFDGVWAPDSFPHIPKTHVPAALQELHRVLRPEGIALIRLLKGNSPTNTWDYHHEWWELSEFEELLIQAGFTVSTKQEDSSDIEFLATPVK